MYSKYYKLMTWIIIFCSTWSQHVALDALQLNTLQGFSLWCCESWNIRMRTYNWRWYPWPNIQLLIDLSFMMYVNWSETCPPFTLADSLHWVCRTRSRLLYPSTILSQVPLALTPYAHLLPPLSLAGHCLRWSRWSGSETECNQRWRVRTSTSVHTIRACQVLTTCL